ncbi:glycoside hydrolase family 104 protein [Variovorax sp. 3P27G3]|uniref:glycoside hydrolase family 24 protein n=1 Tax=Variovorax sp. 3P27G3 TaxID=2502214 RepID=UPI00201D5024|nr:glycoside hydrolase family 104 protein [Variovorax sp. 3P27G3]
MSGARVIVGVALLGLAAYAYAAYARQAGGEGTAPEAGGGVFDWLDSAQSSLGEIGAEFSDLVREVDFMNSNNTQNGNSPEANVRAFLVVLQQCEGTAAQGDPYRVCFGYSHTVQNMGDHPAVTGEWGGQRLSDQQCAGAGQGPGCVSTAAGAYQMIRPTWLAKKRQLGLPDFSPASQDAAAVQLLRDCGAYTRLAAGDLAGAVSAARRTWASLPGANYAGQGMRSMSDVTAWYQAAGGGTA